MRYRKPRKSAVRSVAADRVLTYVGTVADGRAKNARNVERHHRTLPAGIIPRGLSRRAAAEYCGLPLSTFDARVNDGLLPGPVFGQSRRRVWDRVALDRALNSLSGIVDDSSNPAEETALRALRDGGGKRALRR